MKIVTYVIMWSLAFCTAVSRIICHFLICELRIVFESLVVLFFGYKYNSVAIWCYWPYELVLLTDG